MRRSKSLRLIAAAALVFVIAAAGQCSSKPAPPQPAFTPIVSVEELMEHIVDPAANVIFDSVVTTATAQGIVETKPTTEEDWLKVQRAALVIAEATNLLKMPRKIAEDDNGPQPGAGPELTPPQILAKIDADRAAWGKYVDGLRDVAVKGIAVAKAKDVNGVFDLGGALDMACENCHLEYWYPGDKSAKK
jgi:hypothetical protein